MKKKSMLWIFLLLIMIVGLILYLRKKGVIGEEVLGEDRPESADRKGLLGPGFFDKIKGRIQYLLNPRPTGVPSPPLVGGNGTMPQPPNGITLWKENGITLEPVLWREGGLTLEEKRIIDRDLKRLQIDPGPYIYQKQFRT